MITQSKNSFNSISAYSSQCDIELLADVSSDMSNIKICKQLTIKFKTLMIEFETLMIKFKTLMIELENYQRLIKL